MASAVNNFLVNHPIILSTNRKLEPYKKIALAILVVSGTLTFAMRTLKGKVHIPMKGRMHVPISLDRMRYVATTIFACSAFYNVVHFALSYIQPDEVFHVRTITANELMHSTAQYNQNRRPMLSSLDILSRLQQLEELDLSGAEFPSEDCKEALNQLSSLRKLIIYENSPVPSASASLRSLVLKPSEKNKQITLESIKHLLPQLTSLEIHHVKDLALLENATNLKQLIVRYPNHFWEQRDEVMSTLDKFLSKMNLEELDIDICFTLDLELVFKHVPDLKIFRVAQWVSNPAALEGTKLKELSIGLELNTVFPTLPQNLQTLTLKGLYNIVQGSNPSFDQNYRLPTSLRSVTIENISKFEPAILGKNDFLEELYLRNAGDVRNGKDLDRYALRKLECRACVLVYRHINLPFFKNLQELTIRYEGSDNKLDHEHLMALPNVKVKVIGLEKQ